MIHKTDNLEIDFNGSSISHTILGLPCPSFSGGRNVSITSIGLMPYITTTTEPELSYIKDKSLPNICIIGHGEHGKDAFAKCFKDLYGMEFSSSSQAAAKLFIFNKLKDKYGYETFEQCYLDRRNRRKEWHDLICEYNFSDKARLAKHIMSENNIYVGMRSSEELKECKRIGLFDYVIFVYRPGHPLEGGDSFNIEFSDADFVVFNNTDDPDDLYTRAEEFMNYHDSLNGLSYKNWEIVKK